MARAALRDDFLTLHGELTADVVRESAEEGDAGSRLDAWMAGNALALERCLGVLADIRTSDTYDLTTLPVALRELRNLIQSTAPVDGSAPAETRDDRAAPHNGHRAIEDTAAR
jgi:glutamate dehydrogenase